MGGHAYATVRVRGQICRADSILPPLCPIQIILNLKHQTGVALHTCNASTTAEGGTGQQREDTLWQPLAYTGTLLPRPLTHTYVHTERHSCRPNYWVWWSDLVRERACCQIWCPEFNPWKPHDWKRESNPASFLWSPQICFSTQGHGVRGKERFKRTKDKEKKVS